MGAALIFWHIRHKYLFVFELNMNITNYKEQCTPSLFNHPPPPPPPQKEKKNNKKKKKQNIKIKKKNRPDS